VAYQMKINLTEQEYAALIAEAKKSGKQPETLLHEIMLRRLQPSPQIKRPLTSRELMEKQYREGKILNIPVRRPLTRQEQAERERLARLFSGGKPASEMAIEDRGPY
jgi:hypothetical protein